MRRVAAELTLASFLVLFQELALIRWLPGQVRVIAYFPNVILLAAFLGLGLGCLLGGRRSLLAAWPATLLVILLAGWGLSRVVFTQASVSEHLWMLYYDLPRTAPVVRDVRLPILVCFLLAALAFVPLGQAVAERLQQFRLSSNPLAGYAFDITGSLLGVVAFTLVGISGVPPVGWFGMLLAFGAPLYFGSRAALAGHLTLGAACLVVVTTAERAERYSPYYAVSVDRHGAQGFAVLTNGSLHQYAFSLSRASRLPENLARTRAGYQRPLGLLPRPPRRALVVGAGTGNDVSVLLGRGVESIDAVEIDPVILDLGRNGHPDRPYSSPRVRTFNTDARSFLRDPRDPYDLVVFGTLDSYTRLSALSAVRLENFVYTRESLRAARAHLSPEGGLVLYSMVPTDYIDLRLGGMLAEAFGEVPLVIREFYGLFNRIYMVGPAFAGHGGPERQAAAAGFLREVRKTVELPSDDWPHLYLRERGVTGFYLSLGAALVGLSVLGVILVSGEMRRVLRRGARPDWEMFLFGLAFLLLETRSVTEMNLVWGATWLTSAVVFGSILLLVLLATLAVRWKPLPYGVAVGGLAVTLLASYVTPAEHLLTSDLTLRLALSVGFVGLPIGFASACFALLFREREAAGAAFGWNLLGAVVGGVLELASMAVGLKALLLIALAAYLSATLLWMRKPAQASGA